MAWTTKTGVDFRSTAAFATDPSGCVCNPGDPTATFDNPTYSSNPSHSNSPLTINGNTFNIGWGSGAGNDGARDRTTSVDIRLAGRQGPTSGALTLQFQCGAAAGQYKIWMGICDQGNGTGSAVSITISDTNGTLATVTTASALTANQVCGADGTVYATAAAWAATADTSGNSITITTTDTSNGNGGPLLSFACANATPIAHIAVQFIGASGTSAAWFTA